MPLPRTEQLHPDARGLDALPPAEAARLFLRAQSAAAAVAEGAAEEIAAAAGAMATAIRSGCKLWYVGAGAGGMQAAADAIELPATFSIPLEQVRLALAGGLPDTTRMNGGSEDDAEAASVDLRGIAAGDVAIAVSASGTTPYTCVAADVARRAGAVVIGIANVAPSRLLDLSDHAIELATPAEIVAGSTRLGAGTAQKIALNALSTLMAVALGHVQAGRMVNLYADNAKLRARARRIVAEIAGVGEDAAATALDATDGAVKPAILVARGLAPEAALAASDNLGEIPALNRNTGNDD